MNAKEFMMRPWEDGFDVPESFNMVSLLLERHLGGSDGIVPPSYIKVEK